MQHSLNPQASYLGPDWDGPHPLHVRYQTPEGTISWRHSTQSDPSLFKTLSDAHKGRNWHCNVLYSSTNGADNDSEIQPKRMLPTIPNFISKSISLLFIKFFERFKVPGILGDKGALLQRGQNTSESFLLGKRFDIFKQYVAWDIR